MVDAKSQTCGGTDRGRQPVRQVRGAIDLACDRLVVEVLHRAEHRTRCDHRAGGDQQVHADRSRQQLRAHREDREQRERRRQDRRRGRAFHGALQSQSEAGASDQLEDRRGVRRGLGRYSGGRLVLGHGWLH
jgi:hypothetical protein